MGEHIPVAHERALSVTLCLSEHSAPLRLPLRARADRVEDDRIRMARTTRSGGGGSSGAAPSPARLDEGGSRLVRLYSFIVETRIRLYATRALFSFWF